MKSDLLHSGPGLSFKPSLKTQYHTSEFLIVRTPLVNHIRLKILLGELRCGSAVFRNKPRVSAPVKKQINNLNPSIFGRHHERGQPVLPHPAVGVCLVIKEESGDPGILLVSRKPERRPAVMVGDIRLSAEIQQTGDNGRIARCNGAMERGGAIIRGRINRFDTGLDQNMINPLFKPLGNRLHEDGLAGSVDHKKIIPAMKPLKNPYFVIIFFIPLSHGPAHLY
jgi:hypothetical protein